MSDPGDLATDTMVQADWDSQKLSREKVMSEVYGGMGEIRPKPSKDWAHRIRNSDTSGPMAAIEDNVSDHKCRV